MTMGRVALVTGANGFVGRHTVSALRSAGWHVRLAHRSSAAPELDADVVAGLNLDRSTDWRPALRGVDAVIHLAARAHRSSSLQEREEDLYFSINVEGTIQLARCAAESGVRSFIFLSSIAVNGSTTDGRLPFGERDTAAPVTIYGKSKAAAEERLADFSKDGAMAITAVRAPMIYGRGAPGNFQKILSVVRMGVPLPFASIDNCRAFLGVENLNSFIVHRLAMTSPPNFDVFLVADDQQVSTAKFISELAKANGSFSRLFPIPVSLLRAPLRRFGLDDALLGSLEVQLGKAHATGWRPPLSLSEGLALAVAPRHPS